jgi:hypothetical protein
MATETCDMNPSGPRIRLSARRGAALVEAAAVMPVLVIFYGILLFVFHEYDLKGSLMAATRHEAFRMSLRQCQDASDPKQTEVGFGGVPSFESSVRSPYAPDVIQGSRLRPYVETRGMKAIAMATGTATNAPLSQAVRSRTISSESEVFCVPRSMGGGQDYVPPARTAAIGLVETIMGPALDLLRKLFDTKFS